MNRRIEHVHDCDTFTDQRMAEIVAKVQRGERLNLEDGVYLYQTDDLLTLGQLANEANLRKNGKKVYFIENMSLYFTNVCESRCAFAISGKTKARKAPIPSPARK